MTQTSYKNQWLPSTFFVYEVRSIMLYLVERSSSRPWQNIQMPSCPGVKRSGRDGQDRPADILLPVRTGSPVPQSCDDECGWNERQLVPFINTRAEKHATLLMWVESSNGSVFLPKEERIIRISEHQDSYIVLMNDPSHPNARPTAATTVGVC